MAYLIAIVYPDEATGPAAAGEKERLAGELVIPPDAVAAVSRNRTGTYTVVTHHHQVAGGVTWGGFWGLLFGMLFLVPVFGMALGAGLGRLVERLEGSGIDRRFQDDVRALVRPGASALFLVVDRVTPDAVARALDAYGGQVVVSPLSPETVAELQEALQGGVRVSVV